MIYNQAVEFYLPYHGARCLDMNKPNCNYAINTKAAIMVAV